jgi:hypothetical protein
LSCGERVIEALAEEIITIIIPSKLADAAGITGGAVLVRRAAKGKKIAGLFWNP